MRRKTICFFLLLSLVLFFVGCDKNEDGQQNDTHIEITLSKQLARVDKETTIDKIRILTGNGDYKILMPKEIWIEGKYVKFTNEILNLRIDSENNIVIERKLLDDQMLSGMFMLVDSKQSKRVFAVNNPDELGLYDFEAIESKLLNNPDYWQK